MDRKTAIEQGFTINNGQRPVAYKGARFNPSEWRYVPTEGEEQLSARVSELEAHNETCNIELLASVQQCAQLKEQLAERRVDYTSLVEENHKLRKTLALAHRAMVAFSDPEGRMPANAGEFNDLAEALTAIDDSELIKGLVLCDAEPVAYTNAVEIEYLTYMRADNEPTRGAFWKDYSEDSDVPLYAPRRVEK